MLCLCSISESLIDILSCEDTGVFTFSVSVVPHYGTNHVTNDTMTNDVLCKFGVDEI